jgi:hypothetical protein
MILWLVYREQIISQNLNNNRTLSLFLISHSHHYDHSLSESTSSIQYTFLLTLGALIITTTNPPSALVFTADEAKVSSSFKIFPEKINFKADVAQPSLVATRPLKLET